MINFIYKDLKKVTENHKLKIVWGSATVTSPVMPSKDGQTNFYTFLRLKENFRVREKLYGESDEIYLRSIAS